MAGGPRRIAGEGGLSRPAGSPWLASVLGFRSSGWSRELSGSHGFYLAELALLQAALARDMPVLAICRGSQLLNVGLGGDLVQHLPEVIGDEKHKQLPGEFSEHDVIVEPETTLAELLGEHAPVKSHHHQGFGKLGAGLRESARAEDGTIEALEDPSRRFALGVLWHPEAGEDARLFEALVAEAAEYRALRGT